MNLPKINILISFAYWRKDKGITPYLEENRDRFNVLVDSGAFTAHTVGQEINLDEYHSFLKENDSLIDEYIQLDVIGDPKETKINLQKSRDAGFDPLPVFTKGHTIDYLEELEERFCIGGLGGQDRDEVVDILLNEYGENCSHILGCDDLKYFKHNSPPESMDASNWLNGVRFGKVPIAFPNGKIHLLDRRDLFSKRSRGFREGKKFYKRFGIELEKIWLPDQYRNTKGSLLREVQGVSAVYRQNLAKKRFNGDLYFAVTLKKDIEIFHGEFPDSDEVYSKIFNGEI